MAHQASPKKMKSMAVCLSRTIAPGYGDLTLSSAEPEEVKFLRILGVTLDSKLSFKTHFWQVLPKAVVRAGGGGAL